MAWVFRTTHDHLDLRKYVRLDQPIEHLAKPRCRFDQMAPGDLALLWVRKGDSPYKSKSQDGRAIYAFGRILSKNPLGRAEEPANSCLLPGISDAAELLARKAGDPHAKIEISRALDDDEVVHWNFLQKIFPGKHPIFSLWQTVVEIPDQDAHTIMASVRIE